MDRIKVNNFNNASVNVSVKLKYCSFHEAINTNIKFALIKVIRIDIIINRVNLIF